MACTSLVALPRSCGTQGIVAGLEKLYIASFADLKSLSGAGTPTYTETAGVVSNIGFLTGKEFVEVGLLKSSSGLKETLTKNLQNGTAFFTQDLTLVLSDITPENRTFIQSVLNQPVAFLLKSRTGKYFSAGLNGLMELSTADGGSGTAEADLTGYTLMFAGISNDLMKIVDPALVPTILAPGA